MEKLDEKRNQHTEMQLEIIYQLVKKKDEKALATVIETADCIGIFQGENNPIVLLAKEGDYESVEFLINKFKASLNPAVRGAAHGCHLEFMNELIERGASVDYAAWGAACGGHVELTNELINRGASLDFSAYGAAQGGHIKLTNDLIARGASIDHAVNGAASGGNVALINDLILRGASVKHAVRGAWNADHNISTRKNALSFISFIDDSELRNLLAEKAKNIIESLDTKVLLEQATKLNQLMREGKLTFKQAQEYLETGANT